MENIKKFLGDQFKEDMTPEQIVEALNSKLGSGKYKNIANGEYVDVDKYNKAIAKAKEDSDKAKQYDELKTKYDEYVTKEHETELETKISNAKVKKEFTKFVRHEIGDAEDFDKALTEYVKKNPQYLEQKTVVVDSNPRINGGEGKKQDTHKSINDQIRSAAGFNVE